MATKGYHHMTLDQTLQYSDIAVNGKIAEQHCAGAGSKQTTISREIARNSGSQGYIFMEAERRSAERRSSASGIPRTPF
jgi:IS30 family transposase